MVRSNKCIALDSVIERRYKTVQYQIEFQHLVTALRNILSEDSTPILTDLMTESH